MRRPVYKVLSIDGGGMRGLYSVAFLQGLAELGGARYGIDLSDFGKQFDLIVGTSTGAILGGGLAAGIPLAEVHTLYADYGKQIFPVKLPSGISSLAFHNRSKLNKQGDTALREILGKTFGSLTLRGLYQDRGIGLVIPAVNCTTHKAWVFKTSHDPTSSGRDDDYLVADACLASSAAPIYRSLAAINKPGDDKTKDLFADGGLWANNPVLVALIEALRNTKSDQQIEIYCLGTSPAPAGSVHDASNPHWGLTDWKFGGAAVELSLDSQSFVFDQMASMLTRYLDRSVSVVRFPQPPISGDQGKLLDLDDTTKASTDLLKQLAASAVDLTNQLINSDNNAGDLIARLIGCDPETNLLTMKRAG